MLFVNKVINQIKLTQGYYNVIKNPLEPYKIAYFNPNVKGNKRWLLDGTNYEYCEIYRIDRNKIIEK